MVFFGLTLPETILIINAEEFNKALGIPYRIVNIVSGKVRPKNTI
jgi:seryl-tRNA synthetase